MKNLFYTFLISTLSIASLAAIDTGTGADGSCNWGGPNIASGTYNCTDLTVSGAVLVTGNNPLIIKVQGDVNINNSLTLSGQNGSAGGAGVAGGYNGGAASTNGSGPSAGTFGNAGANEGGGFGGDGGGGGSGGSHGTLGSVGADSDDTNVAGGVAPTATYDSTTLFKTSMNGGAGGGGGGSDSFTNSGAQAGGGGGVLRISAGGTVTITSSIIANGGNGDTSSNDAGGGGGGAGGAIFIETSDHITITGSISAIGGNGGTGTANGGNGGNGGNGLIRLDDSDGSVVGSGLATPTPSVFQADVSLSSQTSELNAFSSDISPGCALREVHDDFKFGFIFLGLLFLASNLLLNFNQRQEVEVRR